jgi:Zn-dependent peptidase ImmA (M78 family)
LEKQTGVTPDYKPLGKGLDGYTDSERMECIICADLAEYGEDEVKRRRFRATLAHETGHCYLHVHELRERNINYQFLNDCHDSFKRYKQEEVKAYVNPEWQAWRFAGAILMPECCVRAAIDKGWTKKMMRRAFDVNPSFLDVRLRDLRISNNIKTG